MNAFQVTNIDEDTAIPDSVTINTQKGCCVKNTYTVGFPLELDGGTKAAFIGAVIFIDLLTSGFGAPDTS